MDELKREIEQEFMYRAKHGRVTYSMEEIIYIVWKVIDDWKWGLDKVERNGKDNSTTGQSDLGRVDV